MENNVGKIEMTYDREFLVKYISAALRSSGKTCDEESWSEVTAQEAVACLYMLGVLK